MSAPDEPSKTADKLDMGAALLNSAQTCCLADVPAARSQPQE
jgi:hypothetical protein